MTWIEWAALGVGVGAAWFVVAFLVALAFGHFFKWAAGDEDE